MPPRPAKGQAAMSLVASRGAPDSLQSFLGDLSQPVKGCSTEKSAVMEISLRSLQKSNETTLLKALAELNREMPAVPQEELLQYLPQVVEAVIRHAEHSNATVRSGVFALLQQFLLRGELLQQAVAKRLPKLAPVWVARMNDMEPAVRKDASDAFNAVYTADVLKEYADVIVTSLLDNYKEIIAQGRGKPLQDDTLDRRSNILYSCVCAMGYVVRLGAPASACSKVVQFVENNSLQPITPQRDGNTKGSMVAKAPVVRSAPLVVLRDILSAKIATPKVHKYISTLLYNAVMDRSAVVLRRAWELQLFWFDGDSASALSHLQGDFLRVVMKSFANCTDPEVAEIIYPSLVPFLVPVTRSPAFSWAIEEFADALQQKLLDSVEATVQGWDLVLSSVTRVWELRCVRSAKLGEGHELEGSVMFSFIIATLTAALEQPVRRCRLLSTTASTVTRAMGCVSRHTECFGECVRLLCSPMDSFPRLAARIGDAVLVESFEALQATLVGSAILLPGVHAGAEILMMRYTREGKWCALAELFRSVSNTYEGSAEAEWSCAPSVEVRLRVTSSVVDVVKLVVSTVQGNEDIVLPTTDVLQQIVTYVLGWNDDNAFVELQQIASGMGRQSQWLCDSLRNHELRDPKRLYHYFLKACEEADFVAVELSVDLLSGAQGGSPRILGKKEKEQVKEAVSRSLRQMQSLASADESEGEGKEEEEQEFEESASSSGACGGEAKHGKGEDDDECGSEADSAGDAGDANRGSLIRQQLMMWADFLRRGQPFATLLEVTAEDLDLPALFRAVAFIAPQLQAWQHMSIKALRTSLQMKGDPLLGASSRKIHSVGVKAFLSLVDSVKQLLDSHNVSMEERDTVSLELFDSIMANPHCSVAAFERLQHIVPFASRSLVQGIACSSDLWLDHQVELRAETVNQMAPTVPFALLDQYLPLTGIVPSMLRCVRTSQLIHLLASSVQLDPTTVVIVGRPLLHAARVQEVLAESTRRLLMTELLPNVLLSMSSPKEVCAVVFGVEDAHKILCTLCAVVRDIAQRSLSDTLKSNVRCIVSTATQWIVEAALLNAGNAPVHEEAIGYYRACFSVLDEAADIAGDSFLAELASTNALSAVQEAMCMLPTLEPSRALLTMTVHRHLSHLPVVRGDTVRQIISYAREKRPLDGLEFLAELTSSRITDTEAYNELVHVLTHLLASSYKLRHMPPNNCLVSQAPNDAPISLCDTQRVVVSAVYSRRGISMHNRIDDTLRSSVNLVLFEAVTGCVVSLQKANEEDLALMTKLVAFTLKSLADLGASDVTVLRASEVSVQKVAGVMNYAHQWLCATSIARLDNIGMETVTSAIRAVALLSNLTLLRSKFVLLPIMRQITGRSPLTEFRTEFSAQSPAKATLFGRQAAIISKTCKRKLALFPHLLAWCVTLSGPVQERMSEEWHREVYNLLDLLCALLLCPSVPGSKRIENTYLCNGNDSAGVGEQLGFETLALTRPDAVDPMRELAKGAAAVFALLLQSTTLSIVKSWLETVERKLQDCFYRFVEKHLSPLLTRESLLTVLSKSSTGDATFDVSERYSVSVNIPMNRITLKYMVEDEGSTVHIEFKPDFPLRPPVVTYESVRGPGVSAEKWHVWMRKMTVLLFGGTSNVWECVMLFGRNMDEHFSGKDPCPICFAFVSSRNRLPDMQCAVCRNSAIHSECLYAWWVSGGRTVCPLCRSPWVKN